MAAEMIYLHEVVVRFGQETVLDRLSFSVSSGTKVAVTGLSGSGKSTLLHVLLGFVIPNSGEVRVAGYPLQADHIHKIRSRLAWLPQEIPLLLHRVRDLLLLPFSFARNKAILPTESAIAEIFEAFRLETSLLDKPLQEISGGQKQRVALASCVLLKRPLLLLDEPTAALDATTKKQVIDYLCSLPAQTILSLTHDQAWMDRADQMIPLGQLSNH